MKPTNFAQALSLLSNGKCVVRAGWTGKATSLCLQQPDGSGIGITQPYITQQTADNQIVPYCPTQADILANDWSLAEGAGASMQQAAGASAGQHGAVATQQDRQLTAA
jgi:hypothetical protein